MSRIGVVRWAKAFLRHGGECDGTDDQSSDTQVDVITEEQLLRGMESMTPTEPSANGGGSGSGR